MNKTSSIDKNNPLSKRFDRLENMIEGLASSTAKGFAEVDKRFTEIDKKFSGKFDNLSNRIDDLALNRATREQMKILEVRIDRIEKKLEIKRS